MKKRLLLLLALCLSCAALFGLLSASTAAQESAAPQAENDDCQHKALLAEIKNDSATPFTMNYCEFFCKCQHTLSGKPLGTEATVTATAYYAASIDLNYTVSGANSTLVIKKNGEELYTFTEQSGTLELSFVANDVVTITFTQRDENGSTNFSFRKFGYPIPITNGKIMDSYGLSSATCTQDVVCALCGEVWVEALGHDTIAHEAKDPTCLEDGYNAYETCSRCDHTTYEELPALGHDMPAESCTMGAVCTRCGHVEAEALGHDMQPATCEAPSTCSRCDHTEGDPLGHDMQPATCEAPKTCSRCDHTEGDPLGHAMQDATCETPATCSRCDHIEGAPLGHAEQHHEAKAPTCLDIGWDAYVTCSRCDYTTYEELPAVGHDLTYYIAQEPTCTDFGWDRFAECENCDHTTFVEIPALGHDLEQKNMVEPSCLEDGGFDVVCSRCDLESHQVVPALGHDITDYKAKEPTCTEPGWDAFEKCERCEYTTFEEIPKLPHELEYFNGQQPTCTEDGWKKYVVCKGCHQTTYEVVPATGHKMVKYNAKEPTCLEIGWEAYEACSRCDHTTYEELPALGHDLEHFEAKAPTCTDYGWEAYAVCKRCNGTDIELLPELGHNVVVYEAKLPTCTEIGWDTYAACTRCDATTYEEMPAKGHSYERTETLKWAVYTCDLCDDTYREDLVFRPIKLRTTDFKTAWGMEFVTELSLGEAVEAGEKILLYVDGFKASLLSAESLASSIEIAEEGYLVFTMTEAREESAALATLTFKASNFLTTGTHEFLSTVEEAECAFAPIVIYEMGDVNMDGKINSSDVVLMKKHIVKMITLDAVQFAYANVSAADEKINSSDAVTIQKHIVRMEVTLGDRHTVTFETEDTEESFTVRDGDTLTAIPEAPGGYVWSETETVYTAPIFENITQDKKYYLVKEEG